MGQLHRPSFTAGGSHHTVVGAGPTVGQQSREWGAPGAAQARTPVLGIRGGWWGREAGAAQVPCGPGWGGGVGRPGLRRRGADVGAGPWGEVSEMQTPAGQGLCSWSERDERGAEAPSADVVTVPTTTLPHVGCRHCPHCATAARWLSSLSPLHHCRMLAVIAVPTATLPHAG